VCAHGLELMTLQTEAMVLKQSVVFSNVRERFYCNTIISTTCPLGSHEIHDSHMTTSGATQQPSWQHCLFRSYD